MSAGDHVSRGFYVTDYPANNIDQLTLKYGADTTGTYMITVTARAGAYNGPVIGSATASVSLSSSVSTTTPVTFNFAGAPVSAGSTVTFTQSATGPGEVYYNIGDSSCTNIIETNGTTPPLDTFRGNGVSLTITAFQRPGVSSLSPAAGLATGGSSVTIAGHDFTGATAVKFGTTAAASFHVNSDTSITAVSPPGPAGKTDVTVTTPGGQSATSSADQFTYQFLGPGPVKPPCVVPKLKGKTLRKAKKALKAADCELGKVKPAGQTTGHVKRQSRQAGKVLPAESKVSIKLG